MTNLIVTLLSDQTIPNVQFIKEKQNDETVFLFVSTQKMKNKDVQKWIMGVCNILEDKLIPIETVDEFSLDDIETKLNKLDYSQYENIYVNVTGGTKLMSICVTDFFRAKNAEIYYITGKDCWHIFPVSKRYSAPLKDNITLKDYVESYGFQIRESKLSGIDFDYTSRFFDWFLADRNGKHKEILNSLRQYRGEKKIIIKDVDGLSGFLDEIDFPFSDSQKIHLFKSEIKFLTGEWFEEYIYYRLKQELPFKDNIKTGITLIKDNIENEFDIVFLWNGILYTVECKTSIINKNKAEEELNILNDTIYKVTAIQKNLGLYSKFSILTLSSKDNKVIKHTHLDRGKLFNIDIFDREDILNTQSIAQLLKLKLC